MENLIVEKTQAENKVKTTASRFRYVILAIIGFMIVDIVFYLALVIILEFSIENIIIPLLIVVSIEIPVILKIKP